MKRAAIATVVALTLAACGSNKPPVPNQVAAPAITPITAQKLETTFKRKGIKVEWQCGTNMFGVTKSDCTDGNLKSIEVTEYATSFGNSEANREQAFRVAEMRAKAKLRRFINEDVNTSQIKTVLGANIEKANDRIKQRISNDDVVTLSDDEAGRDNNVGTRENTNHTVQVFVETVRVNAAGILQGVRVHDAQIVDRQTVSVTIRWDMDSGRASDFLRKKFDGRFQ